MGRNVVLGFNSSSSHDDCLIVGDNIQSDGDQAAMSGETLFGRPIPTEVRDLVVDHAEEIMWIFQALAPVWGVMSDMHLQSLERLERIFQERSY